ncbi:MAG: hypothetical protein SOW59_08455 [Corynebacterium sp.]|nr:hypothetical protein [Corynebacterium sp.]
MDKDWAQGLVDFYRDEIDAVETGEFSSVSIAEHHEDDSIDTAAIRAPKPSPLFAGLGFVVALGVIVGGGFITKGVIDSNQGESPMSAQSELSFSCEQRVLPDLVSPEGVVVAFQRAYFSADIQAVDKTLAPSSPLVGEDFSQVVPSHPRQVCVDVESASAGTVIAQTKIFEPDNARIVIYHQRFSVERSESGPRILTIADV